MTYQDKLFEEKDEFLENLKLNEENFNEKLIKMKSIEGFPRGDIDDIISLSNIPYYCAFPNPYINDFLDYFGKQYDAENDKYHIESFVGNITAGKNKPIYRSHVYHTKVPPDAIKYFISHYTKRDDIVFDGFSGSGMTGIACKELGRKCILSDLSPAATFISFNNNREVSENDFQELKKIIDLGKKEKGHLFQTSDAKEINYIIWSQEFFCNFCNNQINYWDTFYDININDFIEGICSNCKSVLTKRNMLKKLENGKPVYTPVAANIIINNTKMNKNLSKKEKNYILALQNEPKAYWYPKIKLPSGDNINQPIRSHSFEYLFDFYFPTTLDCIAYMWYLASKANNSYFCKFALTSILAMRCTKRMPYRKGGRSAGSVNNLSIPSLIQQYSPFRVLQRKISTFEKVYLQSNYKKGKVIVSTQSTTDLSNILTNSIDYIFTDPPFGSNIMYSELNLIWEAWLKVFTSTETEAIINQTQKKDIIDYETLIIRCFSEYFRILKPNRWITIIFHNSKARVWKAIQKAIAKTGFIIGQVAILDKKQGSFKQVNSIDSVKNDLVINAYKPSENFTMEFIKDAGLNLEREFIEMHLRKLPVEPNIERTQQMLYSKLLAMYIQNEFEVNMGASEFYGMLRNHFVERDGYWFLDDQIDLYKQNLKLAKNIKKFNLEQTVLGIDSEKTAIIWLAQFLRTPKTYNDIYIEYSKNLLTSEDLMPELKIMLEENFVTEDGKYRLPSSIEKKEKIDIREKRLTKEFQEIIKLINTKTIITNVRKEALKHGLIQLYKKRDVDLIKIIGSKLHKKIIESDDHIFDIIDWARMIGD